MVSEKFTEKFAALACQGRAWEIPYKPIREKLFFLTKASPLCETIEKEEFKRGEAVAIWVPQHNTLWIFTMHRGWVYIEGREAKSEKFARFVAENNELHVERPDGSVRVEKKPARFYVAERAPEVDPNCGMACIKEVVKQLYE